MNMNYSYQTSIYESILYYIFTVFAFYHEVFKLKLQYIHLAESTFIHCSRMTVVHIHVNVFL